MAALGKDFVIFIGVLLLCTPSVLANTQKNVLFIMADDMRVEAEPFRDHWGFSVAPDELHTPNLAELAANGTTFQKTFCQVSLCGPSRTSMMTGRRPDTSQVYTNNPYWRDSYPFKSLPQHFKDNGYTTAGVGKIYHGDYDDGVNGGYDHPSWSYEKGYKFHPPSSGTYWIAKNKNSYLAVDESDTKTYRRDLMDREIGKKAVEWIEQLKNDKFFLAVGFKLPHLSWVAPEQFFNMHAGNGSVPDNMYAPNNLPSAAFSDSGDLRKHADISVLPWTGTQNSKLNDDTTKELREAYYASVSFVDSLVGELIDALKSNGLYDDTVIVFTSDHGFHLGEHNIWGKKTNFEVANQVPLIISAPGYRSGARSSTELVELIDLFPTVVDLAGLNKVPLCDKANSATTEVCHEGASVVPLLSDSGTAWNKDAIFHQYARKNRMGLSIRTEEFRYTVWLRCDGKTKAWSWNSRVFGYELYDLRTNTYENVNLAYDSNYAIIKNKLHNQLVDGWRKYV